MAELSETTLSDRELIIHLVQHAEDQQRVIGEMHDLMMAMAAELETYRPVFERFRPRPRAQPGRSIFDRRSGHVV